MLAAQAERRAGASCKVTAGIALLLAVAWIGACAPWAGTPDVLQQAVSKKFEQPQKGLLVSAQQNIQNEYGRLAALNGWKHESAPAVVDGFKEHVHAQSNSIAQLGSDAASGGSKAQTLFDDFASPKSPHQFFESAKSPATSFKAELKTLAKQQKTSQAEVCNRVLCQNPFHTHPCNLLPHKRYTKIPRVFRSTAPSQRNRLSWT